MNVKRMRRITTLAGMAMLPAIVVNAGEGHDKEFGHPGQTAEVDRTIRVEARDIDFGHDEIKVRAGETVRFVVRNTGQMQHEFTIGPPAVQKAHRAQMTEMMQSGHGGGDGHHGGDDAHHGGDDDHHGGQGHHQAANASGHGHGNAVMVQPGETKELIWHFERVKDVKFGCNVPGHYEAGMRGDFVPKG
ncbi:cupredoxin domain-containing protein [Ferruginivarius sediminum]|uniref:Blue (type 1) copper domain-containing protein n=1 Tax=Ferruginivarius sediminum TaxID=2661937 RepID=A0A369TBZ6_9PROT|nr:plastocyanin/azurin family copper-binding protein [Ferruginivarius sediminum]RDD62044.1 hypothetical protein DRB17_09395 [Ferruginivarius sediminum]